MLTLSLVLMCFTKQKDGRKKANTRKQPNLSDDEDDDDVNGICDM